MTRSPLLVYEGTHCLNPACSWSFAGSSYLKACPVCGGHVQWWSTTEKHLIPPGRLSKTVRNFWRSDEGEEE